MILVENQGRPHVFSRKNGSIRLRPYERKSIPDEEITEEIKAEIKLGWISSMPETTEAEIQTAKEIKGGKK